MSWITFWKFANVFQLVLTEKSFLRFDANHYIQLLEEYITVSKNASFKRSASSKKWNSCVYQRVRYFNESQFCMVSRFTWTLLEFLLKLAKKCTIACCIVNWMHVSFFHATKKLFSNAMASQTSYYDGGWL